MTAAKLTNLGVVSLNKYMNQSYGIGLIIVEHA